MKTDILKLAAILLFLAGCFSSCWQEEPQKEEEVTPCDINYIGYSYPMTWVYEIIDEWLETGVSGIIYRCEYRDGIGYLFEPLENRNDFNYCFRNCEGGVLYEGDKNPIDACPDLKINYNLCLMVKYPSWDIDQDGTSDEFVCYTINPFSLSQVKEMLHRCSHYKCTKTVSVCTYRDGVGFLLWEHLNAGINANADFLDCNGNLLCKIKKSGENSCNWCPELNIDYQNEKIILHLFISLNVINY